jgi:hypothetical protein
MAASMKHAFALCALLSACAVEDPAVEPAFGPPIPDHENQGQELLGGFDDFPIDGASYAVPAEGKLGATTYAISVNGIQLIGTSPGGSQISGTDLVGLIFTATDGTLLKIDGTIATTPDDLARYVVLYSDDDGASWSDPCEDEGAIPIAGHYSAADQHLEPDGDLTFSCKQGVAYKCANWDYRPGTTYGSDQWLLHETCTHFATADYCMTGGTATREGTAVSMFDRLGVRAAYPANWAPWHLQVWPPPNGEYYVEAAWFPNKLPKCLGKARWASMPTNPCGLNVLPDPRYDPGAKYCEDLIAEGTLTADEPWIISTSLYNDLKLWRWRTPGGDQVTTTRGYYDPGGGTQAPATGMTFVAGSDVLLRELTTEIDPGDVEEVRLYCTTNTWQHCVLTTVGTQPGSHGYDRGIEGYVFLRSGPNRRALKLYNNAAGDYVTSTVQPGLGYGNGTVVGYVIRAPE